MPDCEVMTQQLLCLQHSADVVSVLTDSVDATAYWRKLKQRLKKEGNETVTNCHGLKMLAADGEMCLTDVADTQHFSASFNLFHRPKQNLLSYG